MSYDFDPELDLMIERHLNASRSNIWKAWSTPQLLEKWFTPEPVKAKVKALELHPGGSFDLDIVMEDGTVMSSPGCFLIVEDGHRIIFTDALGRNFRPNAKPFMTAEIVMTDTPDGGCNYIVHVRHVDEAGRKQHEEMGFESGWNTTISQLEDLAKTLEG